MARPVDFVATPRSLAHALARLEAADALSVPLLEDGARRRLMRAAARLPYRPACPVIVDGARAVYQEFDLCADLPLESPFHGLARALEDLLAQALARLDTPPLAVAPRLNDLIVQRYPRGALGITPHRDHIRYEGLVAIVPLCGAAHFFVCADRSGRAPRPVPAPPGHLLLMRAPGFAGRRDRPFHAVRDITVRRLTVGLRHDTRAA